MEDILSLAVVFIFYIIAVSSDKKRKKKRQARRERASAQRMQHRQDDAGKLLQEAEELAQEAEELARDAHSSRGAQAAQQPCREQRIHLHEATQAQMRFAAEGEDPCHHGEASFVNDETENEMDAMDSPVYAQETDADRQQLAQDMLRGVIMSEILTRPCAGRSMQKNRRRVS